MYCVSIYESLKVEMMAMGWFILLRISFSPFHARFNASWTDLVDVFMSHKTKRLSLLAAILPHCLSLSFTIFLFLFYTKTVFP